MPNRIEFHEEAGTEYDAAFDWYSQRNPDAAVKFDREVDRAIEEILKAPQRWAMGPYGTRRFLLRRFPFILIYRERASGNVQIIAVAHASRRPGFWKKRV